MQLHRGSDEVNKENNKLIKQLRHFTYTAAHFEKGESNDDAVTFIYSPHLQLQLQLLTCNNCLGYEK